MSFPISALSVMDVTLTACGIAFLSVGMVWGCEDEERQVRWLIGALYGTLDENCTFYNTYCGTRKARPD